MGIKLTVQQYQQMLNHVAQEVPNEACGLLGGSRDQVLEVIPVKNTSESPFRFRMDPSEQVRALFGLEERGLELIAIYHSHPSGPPGPSLTDLSEAAYPEAYQLIWYQEGGNWKCSAYRYRADTTEEVPLQVESSEQERDSEDQN